MTRFRSALKMWLSAALGLGATAAVADVPSYVAIRSISYAGSGCPAGTVAQNVAPDLQAFTLLFDSFVAEAGPGVALRESRKNCQITVDMDFPNGWQFAVFTADYRGYANLDAGILGEQKSSYYFQGSRQTASFTSGLSGVFNQDYHFRDVIGLESVVWSPCGASRALNINAQVRIDNRYNRYGAGLMTLDSIDGTVQHIYGIRWRRCGGGSPYYRPSRGRI